MTPVGQGWLKSLVEYGLLLWSGLLFKYLLLQQNMNKARIMIKRIPPRMQETMTTASRAESLQLKPAYPNGHCWHDPPTALCPLGQALQLVFEYTMEMKPSLQEQTARPFVFVHVVVSASHGNGSCSHKFDPLKEALVSSEFESAELAIALVMISLTSS